MDANLCCYPQPWWGWWQWTQYQFGKQICEINCGNCICTGAGAAPRGLVGEGGPPVTPDGKAIVATGEEDCHCDHGFLRRLRDFLDHNNRMRKARYEGRR